MPKPARFARFVFIAFGIVAWSCSDAATQIIVNSIAVSLGLTSLTVGQTVQAETIVRDAAGSSLDGQTITWSSSAPAVASVSSAGVVTAVAPGTAAITGATGGKSASVTVTVTARVAFAQLAVSTQPSTTAQSGAAFPTQPVVQLTDAAGTTVADAGVVITARVATGAAALNGTTTATTNASGVATFTNLSIGGLIGARTLEFSAGSVPVVRSNAINITAGPVAQLTLSVQPSSGATSGDAFTVQPTVSAADAWTNPIVQPGLSVVAQVEPGSGSGSLTGTTTATTKASGLAIFSGLAITGSGPHILSFTSGTLAKVLSATVNIVAPVKLVNFDSYANSAAFYNDCATWNCADQHLFDTVGTYINQMTLDDVANPPGFAKAMMLHYRHTGDGCNSITMRRTLPVPVTQELWAEFQIKWSSNFTTANATCPPNDHKVLFGDTESGRNFRWALYVGSDGPSTHTIQVEAPMGAHPNDGNVRLNLAPGAASLAEPLWNGNWHIVRVHFRASTTSTSGDGALELWIDGVLKHRETTLNINRNDGTANGDRIKGLSFSHNQDDGPPNVDMFMWFGRIRVFGANPGW